MDGGKFTIEQEVADALLDVGVRIPLKTFRFPLRKKPVQVRITMKRPRLGTQIRIARLYLALGVTSEQYSRYNTHQRLQFLAEHGAEISRMVALTVCRGMLSGYLFSSALAWFLRWAVEDIYLEAAYEKFVTLLGTKSFKNIIKSAEEKNPLTPLNVSHERKRS
jgi:hypothetical protein